MSRRTFKLFILPAAARALANIRGAAQDNLRRAIRELADDPTPADSIPMHGKGRGLFRIRVGLWRIIYRVQIMTKTVLVVRIGHRSEVYRGLEPRG